MYQSDRIHLKAPGNWINDPNGFIYYRGQYHLFYQYFPYAPLWGTMHWGHAVSDDLVNWEHKGVALFPTKYEDQNGCFSGSAVEHEGRMYLFYTGIHYRRPDPANIHDCLDDDFEACQMALSSEDGIRFDNFNDKSVIIPCLTDPDIGDRKDTRDPKVWRGREGWYMVLGSKTAQEAGKLLFYRSGNLRDWTYAGSTSKQGLGWVWECPDYFETDHRGVLIFSPMRFLQDGKGDEAQTICMLADFDEDSCTMALSDTYQYLDYGLDLYAAQSTEDEKGRRVVVAWLRMPGAVDGAWRGMFCIPRVVEVKDGHIYFRVHPNVEKAYRKRISSAAEADPAGYRVRLELEEGGRIDIGGYRIVRRDGKIHTDRSKVFAGYGENYRTEFSTPEIKEGSRLDIYVDENLIEVYVNGGEYVVSNAVYGLRREIVAEPGVTLQIDTLENDGQ